MPEDDVSMESIKAVYVQMVSANANIMYTKQYIQEKSFSIREKVICSNDSRLYHSLLGDIL